MHGVAFSVDDLDEALEIAAKHDCRPLRGVATYGDVYELTYLRGPRGRPIRAVTLLSHGSPDGVRDIYRISFELGTARQASPHQVAVREHLVLASGRARPGPADAEREVGAGDCIC